MDDRHLQLFIVGFTGDSTRQVAQLVELVELVEDNRMLRHHLGTHRLLLTNAQHYRLAAKAKPDLWAPVGEFDV